MVRVAINTILVALAAYALTVVGWLHPNSNVTLPFVEFTGDSKALALLFVGAFVYVIIDFALAKLYTTFLLVSCGLGCITLPLWIVSSGAVSLWLLTLTNLWLITAPGPLFFLIIGFALSLLCHIGGSVENSEQ